MSIVQKDNTLTESVTREICHTIFMTTVEVVVPSHLHDFMCLLWLNIPFS
jgi:hypothetical protein